MRLQAIALLRSRRFAAAAAFSTHSQQSVDYVDASERKNAVGRDDSQLFSAGVVRCASNEQKTDA
jgi:hypothetical protein